MKPVKNRIWELDFLRGFAILLVVFDHACYDFGQMFYQWKNSGSAFLQTLNDFSNDYLFGDVRLFWRAAFLFLFFFVSGVSTAFSRNNFLRGAKLWGVALAVSFVTKLADVVTESDGAFILFGVLHCLATVILLYAVADGMISGAFYLVKKIRKKENKAWIKTLVCCLVFAAISAVGLWLHITYNPKLADVSQKYMISSVDGRLGMFFYTRQWWTADYFPLIPFVSFFFMGAIVGKTLYRDKKTKLPLLSGVWHTPITFVGRHSLVVYLGGQVFFILLGLLLTNIL